jgi:hypothetical protein
MKTYRFIILRMLLPACLGLSVAQSAVCEENERVIRSYLDHPNAQFYLPIQGFKNVLVDGETIGFQLRLRSGYYRGVYLTLLENFEVTVDGETFTRDQISFSINGMTYSIDELADETEARWQWTDSAVLTVLKQGGLKPGMHKVEVIEEVRISYMPTIPSTMRFRRTIPLVD